MQKGVLSLNNNYYNFNNEGVKKRGTLKNQQFFPGGFPQTPPPPGREGQPGRVPPSMTPPGREGQPGRVPPSMTPPGREGQPGRVPPGFTPPGRGRQPGTPPPEMTPPGMEGAPRTAPPGFIPELPRMEGRQMGAPSGFGPQNQYGRGRFRDFRGCLYRFTYIWLDNGNNFWFYPIFVRGLQLEGFRWRRNGWVYDRINIRKIIFHICY